MWCWQPAISPTTADPNNSDLLRTLLERLEIPIYLVPGNHDERETFRSAFSDRPWMPASGPIDYVIDDFPVRLVGMDTGEPDRHDGTLDARSAFLAGRNLVPSAAASRRFCSSTIRRSSVDCGSLTPFASKDQTACAPSSRDTRR